MTGFREAIHAATKKVWIASSQELLAMTRRQRRLPTPSLQPRRSPTAARGGVSSLPVIASRAKQSISPHERKDGLLRRFRLRSLSFGGQVAPRNDGKCSFAFRHGRAQPSEGRRRFRSPLSLPAIHVFLSYRVPPRWWEARRRRRCPTSPIGDRLLRGQHRPGQSIREPAHCSLRWWRGTV